MFGQVRITQMLELSNPATVDKAVATLLQFAEYPKVVRGWRIRPDGLKL